MKLLTSILIVFLATSTSMHLALAEEQKATNVINRITEKLNLETQQQEALQQFFDEKKILRKERIAQRSERKEQRQQGEKPSGIVAELLQKETLSLNELNNIIQTKQATRQDQIQPALKAFLEFRNSLTPEQRENARPILMRMLGSVMGKRQKSMQRKMAKNQ